MALVQVAASAALGAFGGEIQAQMQHPRELSLQACQAQRAQGPQEEARGFEVSPSCSRQVTSYGEGGLFIFCACVIVHFWWIFFYELAFRAFALVSCTIRWGQRGQVFSTTCLNHCANKKIVVCFHKLFSQW